jgi:hypothetical protein
MMETLATSQTSVNFYKNTRPNIPGASHFHTAVRNLNFSMRILFVEANLIANYVQIVTEKLRIQSFYEKLLPSLHTTLFSIQVEPYTTV